MTTIKRVRLETGYLEENEFVYGSATSLVDIQIKNGNVSNITPASEELTDTDAFDGKELLLLPAIREMHCHLDKSKLGVPWRPVTPASNLVERFTKEIDELDALDLPLKERARNLIELECSHGVTFFRSHIDVHPKVGQRYLEETIELLHEYKGTFDYELVAFPQHGLLHSNAYNDVLTALQSGATLVGGVDPSSLDGDLERSLHQTFELATQFNAPIDIHVHDRDDHGRNTVRELIRLTKEARWQNKVAISHAFGLNDFSGEERGSVFKELAENGVHIISSLPLNGVFPPLEELRKAGVHVSLGCDNVYDSWSPLGTGNVIEKLNRYLEVYRMRSQEDLTDALSLITDKPFSLAKGQPWLQKGMEADFILVDSSSAAEFVARQNPVLYSFHRGQLVYQKES
ncbi:amidohydrolase [Geomicrobium sediminis]|uniref:Cytosine/adenosine deaminase-related metal-dependent hydrolase n=1 Tax=Geomicrobium sediminis TaxID=1347788 RepID=A0ABS2PHP2_9BACL|nr:amidohydrolase [Geomicrobium sediminis]MBM7634844.1 cytosine/adenosine deaminase-related metal-dependent hydrolase [Geomicrobium sediminis]